MRDGSLNSGWHPHRLSKPGEFLLSDPEHPAPHKSRAYLIDDDQVTRHAAQCAAIRPALPDHGADMPQMAQESPQHGGTGTLSGQMSGMRRKRRCGPLCAPPGRRGSPWASSWPQPA
jgi:hypothetical protein